MLFYFFLHPVGYAQIKQVRRAANEYEAPSRQLDCPSRERQRHTSLTSACRTALIVIHTSGRRAWRMGWNLESAT